MNGNEMAILNDRLVSEGAEMWSLDQLERVLRAVADGVTVQDRTGRVVFANDAAASLLGFDRPEAIVEPRGGAVVSRFEMFDEAGRPFAASELPGRRALQGDIVPEVLLRFREGDSRDRWATVSARAVRGADGTVEFVVNTFREVTAGRQAEEVRQFQADLLDELQPSIVATDLAGRVTHWNRTAEELFGWPRSEAIGRPFGGLVQAANGIVADGLVERAAAGSSWEGELIVRRRDGTSLPLHFAVSPIRNAAGDVVGVAGAAFDDTDRRRTEAQLRMSEARYRTLADSLPHIVWTARPDGSVDHFNERFSEYTGIRPETAIGWGWLAVIHADDRGQLLERWQTAIATATPFEAEYRVRRADAAYRWFMARGLPLRAADGDVVAWIGTTTDIEDRKRAERGLQFLAEASRALSQSLDYETTLAAVAQLAVPHVADWCAVDLIDASGRVELVGVGHVDPAKVELARHLRERWRPSAAESPVLAGGQSLLIEELTARQLRESVKDEELLQTLLQLDLRSAMAVPLLAGGETIGRISFFTAESGRRFDEADLALAEDLARRIATAVENAQLYRRVSQFKGAVDNATDCIFMYDPATLRFTYVNRGAVDQVGYTTDELLTMTPLDLKPDLDERRYRALLAPLLAGQVSSRAFTSVQRRKDGVDFPVDVVLQLIPIGPDGGRIIAFVRDVTERVETQARLQRLAQAERARAAEVDAVIRAMGQAVVVSDAEGFVTLSNPAADSLLAGAVVPRYDHVMALFDDPDGRTPQLGSKDVQGPVELRLRESRRWVELTAYPVLLAIDPAGRADSAGKAGGTILVMRDITAEREAEAMREAFVGVLSHELRTPVTTIYGGSKVLGRLDGRLSEADRREVYADIEAEAERLYRLVEDLLVLARFGEERVRLGDEPVLLQRILPAVVASEQSRWPETRFRSDVPAGLPTVRADPTYVEQVTRNLLANGAKYGTPGGTVRLSLEAAGDEVVVRVRDEGPGFPEGEADRLFELFYRSPLTASQAPGAGIGLFVCRRLIEAMGGRIWAVNGPAGGAEFGFTLQAFADEE